jgi:glycosyltransferase involved in cell wall biosynthesis
MRVLILTQHFTPEITAARARLHSFAAGLAARGDDVEVICEVPNHPEGVVRPGYRRRLSVQRELDGFAVRYVWVRTSPRKTTSSRMLFYGSYALAAGLAGCLARRPDVVLASSPPLPAAAAGAMVARRHRVPWVMDVRDLWPEVPIAMGELTNARAIRTAERLERRLYGGAAAIAAANDAMAAAVAAKTDDPSKVVAIHNGTTGTWLDLASVSVPRGELGLAEDTFLWTYAGNVGLVQGLESAVEAAGLLGDGYTLLILGDGPSLERLRAQAAELPAGRVEFRATVEPAVAARHMRASDALLVPLAPNPALETTVPVKLFDSCAVGRPVVLAANGESRRLAEAAGAALTIPPGDAEALAAAIRTLAGDEAVSERLGARGHDFAAGFERRGQALRLGELLDNVA